MEYLRTDTVSVGTLYRKAAKLSRGAGAYFCKHFVPAGAQGGGRLPTLPLRCSQGGLPSLPPAYPAFPDAAGGLGGFGRLPALPLVCFVAPIPPAPFPAGRGRDYSFLMQGASPLASPGAEPTARRKTDRKRFPTRVPPGFNRRRACLAGTVSAASGLMPGVPGAVAPGEINF